MSHKGVPTGLTRPILEQGWRATLSDGRATKVRSMWKRMKLRAGKHPNYKEVLILWADYPAFRTWACAELKKIGGWYPRLSIERKNPRGHYCPSNCELIP